MQPIEILTIGDELTEGRLFDTNAGEMSDVLTREGFFVRRHVSVPDERADIVEALQEMAARSAAILVTGGLGPTTDDLTAECAAAAFGQQLHRFEEALEHTRSVFRMLGREMTVNNEKQADLPERSKIIPNNQGTAVGFHLVEGGCRLYFMPGVPREMRPMLEEWVLPDLRAHLTPDPPHVTTLKIYGLGESKVGHMIMDLAAQVPPPGALTIQYRAAFPEIHVRLVMKGMPGPEGLQLLLELTAEAQRRLSPHVFAVGGARVETTFAETVVAQARSVGARIALAESCTGGLVGHQLTSVPGSSEVFLGGVVAYSNEAKRALLGVDDALLREHGAVSAPVAEAMAQGALTQFGATHAVAVTGIAGPGGGTPDKPVGTVYVAVATRAGVTSRHLHLPRDRERVRTMSAWSAMALLRRSLEPSAE